MGVMLQGLWRRCSACDVTGHRILMSAIGCQVAFDAQLVNAIELSRAQHIDAPLRYPSTAKPRTQTDW